MKLFGRKSAPIEARPPLSRYGASAIVGDWPRSYDAQIRAGFVENAIAQRSVKLVYATVAGLRTTQLSINGELVAITSKDSGGWRELLSGAGVRSVSVSGAGVFTGSTAETRIKGSALSGALDDYRLSFESGDTMTGRFLVTRLDYAGDFNGERSYTLSLESSGAVVSA